MTHAGIQMLMEKLNQLINGTHIPIISQRPRFQLLHHDNNIPFIYNSNKIRSQRRQFQLLYNDLQDSIIQTLELQDIDLKKRLTDATEEAQYTLDLFLSWFHINPSLNLDHVRGLFKSIEVEFVRRQKILDQSAAAAQSCSVSRNSLDEIAVGLDRDVELIIGSFLEKRNKVEVVSIVGMGGIGKTTLATKVFNDAYVKQHFHVRVWITVSQTYDKRAVLIQVLESTGVKQGLEEATDSRLRELVHKKLMGQKYLIVIDDIWNIESWDNLKLFFPHGNNESRILLTTRLTEVAKHASSGGLIHHLGFLNQERSWELLCEKVFHGNECPEWSVKPGMQIVDNCKGLPLAVVVIAGVLAKEEAWREEFWVEIAEKTGSYIVGEENGCMEILGLSYNHLPLHLRECFLYLGGFPEDYKFQVKWLICLWLAEGFIEEDGNRSLEYIADGYLMDLIDRNLVIVADKSKSSGAVKACKVHDLVRELCLKKAREERFDLETERLILSTNIITKPYKPVRRFMNTDDPDLCHPSTGNLRSILCLVRHRSFGVNFSLYYHSFVLLRVLDLQKFYMWVFPKGMELLIHLRYLAVWWWSLDFPSSSICNLWNLQTLILSRTQGINFLSSNISDLVNLRHLWSNQPFYFSSIEKPMNLQTISEVGLKERTHSFQMYFPCIKKLTCNFGSDERNDIKSLTCLESLSLSSSVRGKNHLAFPATMKRLTLSSCGLPWSDMSIIHSLPNLQVLKLHSSAFEGSCWNTNEQVFPQLKFLRLRGLDIKQWEVYSPSFPCLVQLEINWCHLLEEIPHEIGDIPTLERIKTWNCRNNVEESVRRIQEEQHDLGNYNLKISTQEPNPNFKFLRLSF